MATAAIDPQTLEGLEYPALRRLIEAYVRTPPGMRAIAALLPTSDAREVSRRKDLARDAIRHHLEGGRVGPGGVADPAPVLQRLPPEGVVLTGLEIARLLSALSAADALRHDLSAERSRYPALADFAGGIPDLEPLVRSMEGKIGSDGRLEDAASPELAASRRRAADLEAALHRRLEEALATAGERGLLQESYVTVRNGRFVIPLRAEARRSLPGLMHGASSTGATVFIEPLETLELNNDLVEEREKELAETQRILSAWSSALRVRLPEIETAIERLGQIDLLGAIAAFGVASGAVLAGEPGEGKAASITLVEARHPVLSARLAERGTAAVPLDVRMAAQGGALVLSGPNAGGKTVALKTIGLLALMNQAGLPVPAREAILPVYRQILADIGDHQSIEASLSTFSARMLRVAEMAGALSPPALVMLDEVGAGTDPEEAGALAVSIVDHFRAAGASVVVTTHHESLKAYAQTTQGAVNASMEVDETTMRPTYRLRPGIAGASAGVDLAERMGLPASVIAAARARLSPQHVATRASIDSLSQLAQEKEQELDRIRAQRAREQEEHARAREEADRRLAAQERSWREAIAHALEKVEKAREEFLGAIKDRTIALQLRAESRREARSLREQLSSTLSPMPGADLPAGRAMALAPGTRVRWRGMKGSPEAVVEAVHPRGRVEIVVRGKRMTVEADDLDVTGPEPAPAPGPRRAPPAGIRLERASPAPVQAELKLIGARVDEALERLDKFLDEAYLAGHVQVRIVHGHGSGRLRQAVRGMLDGHPHVASHAPAGENEGGTGATLVVLKD